MVYIITEPLGYATTNSYNLNKVPRLINILYALLTTVSPTTQFKKRMISTMAQMWRSKLDVPSLRISDKSGHVRISLTTPKR
jgi:hypothetical protein